MSGAARLAALDGVRGLAILLVLLWHYAWDRTLVEPGTAWAYGLALLRLAWSGVDLFFVLSGFLIAGILLDHREAPNLLGVFYLRRICRIFPVYFLLLGLYLVVLRLPAFQAPAFDWLLADPLPLWTYATFTQNIAMGLRGDLGPHGLAVTWSLAVEEQFYLVMPLLVFLLPRRAALAAIVAAALLAPALRYVSPGLHANINALWRCDALAVGAALAFLVRSPPFMAALARRPALPAAVFAVLAAGAALMTLRPGLLGVFDYSWLGLLYAVLILLVFAFPDALPARAARVFWLTWLGRRSYSIYLFHEASRGLLHGLLNAKAPGITNAAEAGISGLALGATLLAAELSYRLIEKPAMRFGHRFEYRDAAARPSGGGRP